MSFLSCTSFEYSADLSSEKYLKKLLGKTEIKDSLKRLDKLTQDEARMATAQLLTLTHGVDDKVTKIDDEVKEVGGKVRDIDDTVRVVHEGAQYVMFSYSFLWKRLRQMEKKQKQSCNRPQKRRLQTCNLWQTTLAR